MFIINTPNAVEYQLATDILAQHDVHVKMEWEGNKAVMVVTEQMPEMPCKFEALEDAVIKLDLCERHFQMHFRQAKGHLCSECRKEIEKTGHGEGFCGHLTFTTSI